MSGSKTRNNKDKNVVNDRNTHTANAGSVDKKSRGRNSKRSGDGACSSERIDELKRKNVIERKSTKENDQNVERAKNEGELVKHEESGDVSVKNMGASLGVDDSAPVKYIQQESNKCTGKNTPQPKHNKHVITHPKLDKEVLACEGQKKDDRAMKKNGSAPLKPGDIVWSKYDTYPPWPSKITSHETTVLLQKYYKRKGVGVLFLGRELSYGIVPVKNVYDFNVYYDKFRTDDEEMRHALGMVGKEFKDPPLELGDENSNGEIDENKEKETILQKNNEQRMCVIENEIGKIGSQTKHRMITRTEMRGKKTKKKDTGTEINKEIQAELRGIDTKSSRKISTDGGTKTGGKRARAEKSGEQKEEEHQNNSEIQKTTERMRTVEQHSTYLEKVTGTSDKKNGAINGCEEGNGGVKRTKRGVEEDRSAGNDGLKKENGGVNENIEHGKNDRVEHEQEHFADAKGGKERDRAPHVDDQTRTSKGKSRAHSLYRTKNTNPQTVTHSLKALLKTYPASTGGVDGLFVFLEQQNHEFFVNNADTVRVLYLIAYAAFEVDPVGIKNRSMILIRGMSGW
ncbi:hypothetical protein VCUG_02304 [Vavraia culicis subsp. floridensis]|uniref:PWWP domain-containing protein n=1 Tax=Vavraia culicis (isolate floridensis) TaxID=948595 RepID=L2GSF0_VAVCU|nr:uncharacterized protein VCUG_02304 [Vavraia culicis subsp. floridensis]ELA46223.1 hypothetical protein VCUG_02304 [Vavraia culicis subsp. floridensis]